MSIKIKKTREKFEVVTNDGTLEYQSLQEAEKKLNTLIKSELFGYVKKTIYNDKGEVLDEIFCG